MQAPETDPSTADLFAAGNYTTVAMSGSPDEWQTYAAMGLLGKTQAALDGLSRFSHPEARFYAAVASWIAGDDATAARILANIPTAHAQNLLALIRKPKIRVLAQLPSNRQPPHDLLTAVAQDGRFTIQNISFHPQDLQNEPYADIHKFYDPRQPPDFYVCAMVEWHLVPPNLQQLPCPILGVTADYDVHIHVVYPWLQVFDELVVAAQKEWREVCRLVRAPVSTFPKLYGIADTLPPIPSGPREIDLFVSGTMTHPYHPDKARLLQQILRMPDIKTLFINGFVDSATYNQLLGHSKTCFTYVRYFDGMVTRGLEALSMGSTLAVQKGSVLTLYVGEDEGVLTYELEADNLDRAIRRILEEWPLFERRARRGAEIIRREFTLSRVASQYLRLLTFLAARPRSQRRVQPAEPLVQKRGVLWKGWLPGDTRVIQNLLDRNTARWLPKLETEASPHLFLDTARELVLDYATRAPKTYGSPAYEQLLAHALNLYRMGLARFPQSLVLRFNMIRTALHFGRPRDVSEALQLAEATLAMPASNWRIDAMEDIFPWDFCPTFFNYRRYFDLVTEHLMQGMPAGDALARLILASLHYYLGHYTENLEQFQQAITLDPDFPFYRLRYAKQLVERGGPGDYAEVGALLTELAQSSVVFVEAFELLEQLQAKGLFVTPRFADLSRAVNHARQNLNLLEVSPPESLQPALVLPAAPAAPQPGVKLPAVPQSESLSEEPRNAAFRRSEHRLKPAFPLGLPTFQTSSGKKPLVSALVPTYKAERYMRGLLEDLEAQTIAGQLEIVIVDSNSPQNEAGIVREFQQRYDNIVYLKTPEWENSHAAMNRCLQLARGKYFTPACTDDRHRVDAFELMVRALEEQPEVGLVYADSLLTNVENETFAHNSATKRYDWPDYNLGTLLSNNLFGPQPMWRREVHDQVGPYDPAIILAGDYDFYIKAAWKCRAVHLRETLGLFLQRDDSNSGRNNRDKVIAETLAILRQLREQIPLVDIYPELEACPDDPQAVAAALWDFGNLCALSPYNDFELAISKYKAALNLQGLHKEVAGRLQMMFANNAGVVLFCAGDGRRARELLQSAIALSAARSNLELMDHLERLGQPAIPIQFRMAELEHPVVVQARQAYGLRLNGHGVLVRTPVHPQLFWDVYGGTNGIPISEEEKAQAMARKPRAPDRVGFPIGSSLSHRTSPPDPPTPPYTGGPGGVGGTRDSPTDSPPRMGGGRGGQNWGAGEADVDPQPLHVLMTMYGWADEGGGTILPRQIAKALVRRGHRVTVICTAAQARPDKPAYYVDESQVDGVQLFAIYNRPALFFDLEHPDREVDDPQMRRIVAQLIADLKPDIVHYHSLLNFSMGVAEEVSRAGIPSVYTSHNYWPICPRMYLFQDDLALCSGPSADGSKCAACIGRFDRQAGYARRAEKGRQVFSQHIDRHLAVSDRVAQIFMQNGHEAARIHVVHQQPETVDWIWQQVGAKRQPDGSLARPLKIGAIGSLLPQKGMHVLVKALQAFQPGQVEGHVFGSGPQPYQDALQQMDRKGLVRFHGRYELAQLPRLLSLVDLVAVPSVWEDCAPLVVAEALAARIPVMGSRTGGIPDFVEDGVNGFLFEPHDAAGLASVLYRFFNEPGLLGRLQGNIQPPRGFDAYLDELTAHYRQVITASLSEKSGLEVRSNDTQYAIRWEGSQFVHHSLALINREQCLQLIDAGHEVSIIPFEPDQFGPEADPRFDKLAARLQAPLSRPADVHVRHQWPLNFTPPPEGHWVIIQPWEFGSAPKVWVELMSTQVDEVWVPSSYVRDCYIRSGVPSDRVHVVPNGVDPRLFHSGASPLDLSQFHATRNTQHAIRTTFNFLFVGGTIYRKGIDLVLEAYQRAFTRADDVCLVVKDIGGRSFYKGQTFEQEIRRLQALPDAARILYLDEDLPPDQLPGLYAACDCLVHPYRGEGFGLPIAEAMACGLPVIVTNHGAALDFCDAETAYLIPAVEQRLADRCIGGLETVDFPWLAEPDLEALVGLLRHVYEHPREARARGARASERIRTAFTWECAAEKAMARLQVLRGQPIRRHRCPLTDDGRRTTDDRGLQSSHHVLQIGGSGRSSAVGRQPSAVDGRTSVDELEILRLLEQANDALARDDLSAAAQALQACVDRYPACADGYVALASVASIQGDHAQAQDLLLSAIELDSGRPELLNQLGCAYAHDQKPELAEAAFRQVLELDPANADALLNLAELCRDAGRYVEAAELLKRALEHHRDNPDVLTAFGNFCLEVDEPEVAQMAFRRCSPSA